MLSSEVSGWTYLLLFSFFFFWFFYFFFVFALRPGKIYSVMKVRTKQMFLLNCSNWEKFHLLTLIDTCWKFAKTKMWTWVTFRCWIMPHRYVEQTTLQAALYICQPSKGKVFRKYIRIVFMSRSNVLWVVENIYRSWTSNWNFGFVIGPALHHQNFQVFLD